MAKKSGATVVVVDEDDGSSLADLASSPLFDIQIPEKIISDGELAQALETFAQLRISRRKAVAVCDKLMKPHKLAIKRNNADKKGLVDKYEDAEDGWQAVIVVYKTEQAAKVELENKKKLEKWDKQQGKVKGAGALTVPPNLSVGLDRSAETAAGTVSDVKVKTWEIVGIGGSDEVKAANITRGNKAYKSIPDEYFILDTAKITKQVKADVVIKGIRSYETTTLSVKE